MKAILITAAALALAACGGTNADDDNANLAGSTTEATMGNAAATPPAGSMGVDDAMMNDMATANDVALSNAQ